MKRSPLICAIGATVLVGCAGSNTSTSYGSGYDPSLNAPGTPGSSMSKPGTYPTPNVAAWPVENGAPIILRGVSVTSIPLAPAKVGDPNPYKGDQVDSVFKDLDALGFNVARVQIFDGTKGLKIDKDGGVSGVDDVVLKNLDDLVERAKVDKIELLLDFNSSFADFTKSPIADKKARETYDRNVFGPIARRLKAKDGLFGFELHNNLYGEISTAKDRTVDKDAIRSYVKDAVDAIKRQDPQRVVGSGPIPFEGLQNNQMAGLGLDYYSLYKVDDKGVLPDPMSLRLDRPLVAGYISQATGDKNDDLQSEALKAFIRNATAAKYAGYFVWSYSTNAADDAHSIVDKDGKHKVAAEAVKSVILETKK